MKKKILFIGDSPDCPSGFGRATRELLSRVHPHYDVTVLGINHRGDPSDVPYPVYTAAAGGDVFGIGRLMWMCGKVQPDAIVIQQDGWYIPYYVATLRKRNRNHEYEHPQFANLPIIGSIAVDGKHFDGKWIEDLTAAVFWTQFAYDEAREGGFAGRGEIIRLGVDQEMFYPCDRDLAMERAQLTQFKDKFIVGNVNRNQPRKRWDLTLRYFAKWIHEYNVRDAYLFLHTAPTGDQSINVESLAKYYGIHDRTIIYEPEVFYGKSDDQMRDLYNCFDVLMSTTQGEGMGLPAMEAMACSVPCILPDWSAFGDWAVGAAALVPCTSTALQTFSPTVNVVGGVADEKAFVQALDTLYRDKSHRELVGSLGMSRISDQTFRWDYIGQRWLELLDSIFTPPTPLIGEEIWQDLKA
jgi:glycosyltransferase involved in cell wall biosynthesis